MLTDGKTIEFTKALARAQDAENRYQLQLPGRHPDPTPHSCIRHGAQTADQIKIDCSSWRFRDGIEAIPSRSPQAEGSGQGDWSRLQISPGAQVVAQERSMALRPDADQTNPGLQQFFKVQISPFPCRRAQVVDRVNFNAIKDPQQPSRDLTRASRECLGGGSRAARLSRIFSNRWNGDAS